MLRFLNFGQCQGVLAARVGAGLKGPQAIGDDSKQDLLGEAVRTLFWDRAVLKQDSRVLRWSTVSGLKWVAGVGVAVESLDEVEVVSASRARLIADFNGQLFVARVDDVIGDITHDVPFENDGVYT